MNPEVLIAGAGPVGLTLALELARFGVAIRIVDKAKARTDKSKAICVWSRSLELLARAGVAEELVSAGEKVGASNLVSGSHVIAHLNFEGLETPYPFALMVPQSETERILEAALARHGVTVERSTELTSFTAKADQVEAVLQASDGATETLQAGYLIGCDGAHSLVRHTLGLSFAGETVEDEFILADIVLSGGKLATNELSIFWHQKGIVALFPMPGGRTRLIASTGLPAADAADPQLADVQAILDERCPGGFVASDPVWIAPFRINERKVENYRSGRVFLAGDAAHVHSPAGGQGMNTGMQDAVNLAWKLALVLKGEAAGRLLDSYSIERSAVAAKVIEDSGRLLRVSMVEGAAAQRIRNFVAGHILGLTRVREALGEELSELAIEYDKSPLNGTAVAAGRLPRPGHRLPPPDGVPVGGGESPRFAILAPAEGAGLASLGRRQRNLVEDGLRPPVEPQSMVLVRPDGYVALIAEAGDWRSVDAYLAALV